MREIAHVNRAPYTSQHQPSWHCLLHLEDLASLIAVPERHTLMTATPPASLAMRSDSFSVSYVESVSDSSFFICATRWSISSLLAASAMMVHQLLPTVIC